VDVLETAPLPASNGRGSCLPRETKVHAGKRTKAFKVCARGFPRDEFNESELKDLVATVLDYKIRFVDTEESVHDLHEYIEFELPGVLSLMHIVLEYLIKRVEKLGVVNCEQSNLFVALDEAFVNAVKHGNKFDTSKSIRVAAEVSQKEARFTIEDEGDGFDVGNVSDPRDPENLFKTSGRGVLFIYNIMDEVIYNERGNRLTMVKRGDPTV
jgi:serine/threonine-protein kinase RsbW